VSDKIAAQRSDPFLGQPPLSAHPPLRDLPLHAPLPLTRF